MMKNIVKLLLTLLPQIALAQTKQAVVPDTLASLSKSYSQAIIASGHTVYIAGQVPVDGRGNIVGRGNFEQQVEQVFKNMEYVLKAAGCSMDDLVKINYNIVDLDPTRLAVFRGVAKKHGTRIPPVSTLLGVKSLYDKDVLIEIDAIAVIK